MELVNYDQNTKEYTLKMSQLDFLDLLDLASGVYSTSNLQDFTALGVQEERVNELSKELRNILKEDLKAQRGNG